SRSERRHKAWGASPRIAIIKATEPAKRATAWTISGCRPFHGLERFLYTCPGAGAPGFMLPLASRALLYAASRALLTLLPAAGAEVRGCASDFDEAGFVGLGVEIDAVTDPAEDRTTHALFSEPVSKIEHRVSLAPVFAVFPYLHGRAANLCYELD